MTEQDLKVLKELNGDTCDGMSECDDLALTLVRLKKEGYVSAGGYPYVTEYGKEYLNARNSLGL